MASLSATITQGCAAGQGVLTLSQADPAPGAGPNLAYAWAVLDGVGNDYGGPFDPALLPVQVGGLPNGPYSARVTAVDQDNGTQYRSQLFTFSINCAAAGGGGAADFHLDSYGHTDETAAGGDGTATVQASGGVAPLTALLVELSQSQPASSGQPNTFPGLPASKYTLRVSDSSTPTPQVLEATVTVAAYAAPVAGCQDEYADNYDPTATSGGTSSCSYSPRWRSAWGPSGMAVAVAAVAGQTLAYIEAELRVGFRPGHPLAEMRPLGAPISLRATVGPTGYATFKLGPYVQPLLGVEDGAGGYELDLNSPSATTSDLYVGYELRRTDDDTLLEHGYALNAAVPDEWLVPGRLSPFTALPLWPGFDDYRVPLLTSFNLGKYGELLDEAALHLGPTTQLPCPSNPLLVAWLAPGGGYGYWVFQGRGTQVGLSISDGQTYQRPDGQRRYSERGEARRTYEARSGVFKGADLAEGLATLQYSPQVWVQPELGGEWVAVTLDATDYAVRKLGQLRNEVVVKFTGAGSAYSQGQ